MSIKDLFAQTISNLEKIKAYVTPNGRALEPREVAGLEADALRADHLADDIQTLVRSSGTSFPPVETLSLRGLFRGKKLNAKERQQLLGYITEPGWKPGEDTVVTMAREWHVSNGTMKGWICDLLLDELNSRSHRVIKQGPEVVMEGLPAVGHATLKVENTDDEDGFVLVTTRNVDWAKIHQSLLGSRWKGLRQGFAYVLVPDEPDLISKIQAEAGKNVTVDDGEYSPFEGLPRPRSTRRKVLHPGDRTRVSGQYRDSSSGNEVTSVAGHPLPPTRKYGAGYRLVDATKHEKPKSTRRR